MARYRKIDTKIWADEKFRALSNHGKLAFLFLLTHPHMTSLGAMRATLPGLAAEIGWTPKAFREAFREAFRKGMVKYDETAACIVLPRFLKYNGPENPNVVKSWQASIDIIPECDLKNEVIQTVKAFVEALPKAFREALPIPFVKAFPIPYRKGMPNQEQEQEQEPEQEHKPKTPIASFDTFWTAYPKKLGKASALKAWKTLKPDAALLDVILKAIVTAKASQAWLKDNGQFIPHPASWLNGKRWEDELTPPSPTRTFRDLSKVYRDELPSPSHKKPPTSHDHPVT